MKMISKEKDVQVLYERRRRRKYTLGLKINDICELALPRAMDSVSKQTGRESNEGVCER